MIEKKIKLLIFVLEDQAFIKQRLKFAKLLQQKGYDIVVMGHDTGYSNLIIENGFKWLSVYLKRKSLNPFIELKTIFDICSNYHKFKPEIVHHFSLKAILYGSIGAIFSKPKVAANTFTGLGYLFISKKNIIGLIRSIVLLVFKIIGRITGQIFIFQNKDDKNFFENKYFEKSCCYLIPGSGVDCDTFTVTAESQGICRVVLASRMLWDKGVQEFINAAKILSEKRMPAKFVLVGDTDLKNPSAVPRSMLSEWSKLNYIEWLGWQDNMQEVYQSSNIVCLPSYREGLPNVLLEAQASGRAIVATNVPGCREVVVDGYNGFLVRSHDACDLAQKLEILINDSNLRKQMGNNGRKLMEEKFNINKITDDIQTLYNKYHNRQKLMP